MKEKEPILMVVGEDDYNLEAETHLMCVVSPHFSCCSLHETDGAIRVPADNTPLVCMEDTYHTPLEFCYQSLSYHQQCRDVVAGVIPVDSLFFEGQVVGNCVIVKIGGE